MMDVDLVISYLSKNTVRRAVADYFLRNGCTDTVFNSLLEMSEKEPEEFFEMVSEYLEKQTPQ
jgi:hypothetical protein